MILRDSLSVRAFPSSDTHVIFGVDVSFDFEQCDGDIGMTTTSSPHQRRPISLRTHNGNERQSKCVGTHNLGGTTAQPSSTFGVPKLVQPAPKHTDLISFGIGFDA